MNKTAQKLLAVGLLLVALMGGSLTWMWKSLPPQIPWYYSLPSGEQQLTDKSVLIWVLGGAVFFLIVTRVLGAWAGKKDATVEITITAGGLTAILLLAATFFRVMQIFAGT
jgi:hypothetical protein